MGQTGGTTVNMQAKGKGVMHTPPQPSSTSVVQKNIATRDKAPIDVRKSASDANGWQSPSARRIIRPHQLQLHHWSDPSSVKTCASTSSTASTSTGIDVGILWSHVVKGGIQALQHDIDTMATYLPLLVHDDECSNKMCIIQCTGFVFP